MAETLVIRLPDGSIRIVANGRISTVSSEHLVPGRIAELERLPAPQQEAPR
jgi:hypothetical protein